MLVLPQDNLLSHAITEKDIGPAIIQSVRVWGARYDAPPALRCAKVEVVATTKKRVSLD